MKFQDDISNMNTYIRTYIHTYIRTSRNQYAPPLFQSWGHNYDGQESQMLHTMFPENRPAGSGEDF